MAHWVPRRVRYPNHCGRSKSGRPREFRGPHCPTFGKIQTSPEHCGLGFNLWTEGCLRSKEWDIYIHLSSYRWYRWQVTWLLQLNQLLLGLPTPDLSYLHRCHPGWEDTADGSHCYSGRFLFGLSSVKRLKSNLTRTIVNHSIPQITINRWYEPFRNGWFIMFIIVLPSLLQYRLHSTELPHLRSKPAPPGASTHFLGQLRSDCGLAYLEDHPQLATGS